MVPLATGLYKKTKPNFKSKKISWPAYLAKSSVTFWKFRRTRPSKRPTLTLCERAFSFICIEHFLDVFFAMVSQITEENKKLQLLGQILQLAFYSF